jgi:hypothetical protein
MSCDAGEALHLEHGLHEEALLFAHGRRWA